MNAGRELDALVAEKVMGWKIVEYTKHEDVHVDAPVVYAKGAAFPLYRGSCSYPEAWFPSVSIVTAWEVVEKLDVGFDLTRFHRKVVAQFYPAGIPKGAEGDTAPLAICVAALKAVGVEVPE